MTNNNMQKLIHKRESQCYLVIFNRWKWGALGAVGLPGHWGVTAGETGLCVMGWNCGERCALQVSPAAAKSEPQVFPISFPLCDLFPISLPHISCSV